MRRKTKDDKYIDDIVTNFNNRDFIRKFILFERPILRSLRKQYQKLYKFDIGYAERYAIVRHAKDIRKWYERLYLPKELFEFKYGAHMLGDKDVLGNEQKPIIREDKKSGEDDSDSKEEQ
jgi:hypothetical protein